MYRELTTVYRCARYTQVCNFAELAEKSTTRQFAQTTKFLRINRDLRHLNHRDLQRYLRDKHNYSDMPSDILDILQPIVYSEFEYVVLYKCRCCNTVKAAIHSINDNEAPVKFRTLVRGENHRGE